MSERVARVVLGVVAGLALVAAVAIDLPGVAEGRFWSDGATYHAMAGSLAFDRDLDFGPADLARVRAAYPPGPQGVFLKRVGGPGGSACRGAAGALEARPALDHITSLPREGGVLHGLRHMQGIVPRRGDHTTRR